MTGVRCLSEVLCTITILTFDPETNGVILKQEEINQVACRAFFFVVIL